MDANEAVEAPVAPSETRQSKLKAQVQTLVASARERSNQVLDSVREKAKNVSEAAQTRRQAKAETESPPPHPAIVRLKQQTQQLVDKADAVPGVPFIKQQWALDNLRVLKICLYATEVSSVG